MSALALLLATVACATSPLKPVAHHPGFNFGNRRIATALPAGATFVGVPEGRPGSAWVQTDGSIRTKVGWWTAHGRPLVVGRRLDGPSEPLRADVGTLSATPTTTFYPSELVFPSAGCWRITATARLARLDATVLVTT